MSLLIEEWSRKTACKIAAADRYVQICERLIKEFDLGFV